MRVTSISRSGSSSRALRLSLQTWVVFVWVVLAGTSAWAQQAALRVAQGPQYAGVPIELRLVVEGFDEAPQPVVEVEAPAGVDFELVSVSPNISTNVQIVNGRMTQSKKVQFVYRYQLLADQPTSVTVGPFRVVQGARSTTVGAAQIRIEAVPTSLDQDIRVVLPDAPLANP